MAKTGAPGPGMSRREIYMGLGYLAVELLALPGLLRWCGDLLPTPLSGAELNFVYYLINFLAAALIFHDFLGPSLAQAARHPAYFCQAAVLGLAAYYACGRVLSRALAMLDPGFSNYNDAAIAAMSRGNYVLMALGTVVLVPVAEECFFRGLIFRNLRKKSRWAAYCVSMAAFAAVHVLGYLGRYSLPELVLAVLQYLPAGLCLAWSYEKGGTIFTPIVIHACINAVSIGALR